MHQPNHVYDELAWQAFRYVAGEMNAAEEQRFAALLAEDQSAREAVAGAVELAQATASALALEPALRPKSPAAAQRWTWLAAGTALGLAVVLALAPWRGAPGITATAADEALAVQWSEIREQQLADLPWNNVAEITAVADGESLAVDELAVRDLETPTTPDWMLAAVRQQRAADEGPGEIERGAAESQEQ